MTVKQLTKVENGRLVPTTEAVDADIVEVSKEQGNSLVIREDGLYCPSALLATVYNSTGVVTNPKIFITTVVANSEGVWSVNYSHVGFTTIPVVTCSGVAIGTATADKRFASLQKNQPTLTTCAGYLHSSSSAGLLATMTMIAAAGTVQITAVGY